MLALTSFFAISQCHFDTHLLHHPKAFAAKALGSVERSKYNAFHSQPPYALRNRG
jgi:hypothetical protein